MTAKRLDMKIVHVTHHYIDGWGYQDNLLPKYQQKSGNDVVVLTENSHLPQSCKEDIVKKGSDYYDGNVRIRKFKSYLNTESSGFVCSGLYKLLEQEKPDLIFHHGIDSSSMVVSAYYKKKHNGCLMFVDNHVDEINQSKNKLWLTLNNRLWLPSIVRLLSSLIDYFWGVTPLRCEYLKNVFKVPAEKVGLLPFGGDTDVINSITDDTKVLRMKYKIPSSSFVLVSGGKMDASKGTINLIHLFNELKQEYPQIHLVLFGKADREVASLAERSRSITMIGWCNRADTLSLLKLSDVAVWPLLHTTLIDDAISVGTPLIVKMSGNVSHYEANRNGIYLATNNPKELKSALYDMMDEGNYERMKKNAMEMASKYRYENIVQKVDDMICQINSNHS